MIAGRYRLMEPIGSGAMGVVWRARDERLERVIAIKHLLVRPGLTPKKNEEARRRAMREARIAARLHHRNAIALLDVAEHDGDPCLVMEFMPSRSLSAVLAERGTLPPEQVAAIGSQVASALAAAHAAGIVHRDVKPGNILLDDKGAVKITDFGISRAIGDNTITTDTGLLAGTPAYLAPELARGHDPSPASDVFSLGSTLYHALEGAPPFGLNPNPLALLHAVASGDVAPPRNAGPMTSVLMALLSTDPADRPSMEEAAAALALPTAPLPIPPPTLVERTVPARAARAATAASPRGPVRTAPPPPPRVETPRQPRVAAPEPPAPKRGVLLGAVAAVVVLATAVTVVLLGDRDGGQAQPPVTSVVTTVIQQPAQSSSAPPSQPVTGSERITNYSAAGLAVIRFFSDAGPAERWAMLGPNGQAAFGSRAESDRYWSQFRYVSSENANGVTIDPDGSAQVPVTVTLARDPADVVKRVKVRVILVGGRYLIDSDPRVDRLQQV